MHDTLAFALVRCPQAPLWLADADSRFSRGIVDV